MDGDVTVTFAGPAPEPPVRPLPAEPAREDAAVTALIVARDEEHNIAACLQSVLWADRVLVIDNGSTDRTAEIARDYTQWVIPSAPPGMTDPTHENINLGLGLIPAGWVLQVDADERVSASLAAEIRQVIRTTEYKGFLVPFRTAILGQWPRYGYWGWGTRLLRLCRAGHARYPLRSIHERLQIDGQIGDLHSPIYHLPYATVSEFVRKTNLYTTREAGMIVNGSSPGVAGLGRRAAHPSGPRLLWAAVRLFLWSFIRLRAWREGRLGVATSGLLACYGFLETLKAWETAEGLIHTPPAAGHPGAEERRAR